MVVKKIGLFAILSLSLAGVALVAPCALQTAHAETSQPAVEDVTPAVGQALQTAQGLIREKKFKEALATLDVVAAGTPSAIDTYLIARTRAVIGTLSGDDVLALTSYQQVVASGKLTADEQLTFIQGISELYYGKRDYAQAAAWAARYVKEGGTDPVERDLLTKAYYLNNDFAQSAKELQIDLDAAEKSGKPPTEDQLRLAISLALKQNDKPGYAQGMEKLVTYYPRKDYWEDILDDLHARKEFAYRLHLDFYRLKSYMGLMEQPKDVMAMAELAMVAGFAEEARKVIEAANQSGVLGHEPDLDSQKQLLAKATGNAAEDLKNLPQTDAEVRQSQDGARLLKLGYFYVINGQSEQGLALMQQAIHQPELANINDAKLHLGVALALADHKQDAIAVFKTVAGGDGTAELAHYWTMQLTHPIVAIPPTAEN